MPRRVAEPRRAGVQISTILRQAIPGRAREQRVGKRSPHAQRPCSWRAHPPDHPDPPDLAPRGCRLDDRRAVRSAFEMRLRKRK
jgi:hypothetical protein